MKYIDADKVRAEIERLYGEYKDKFHRSGDSYHLGLIDGLDMAERALDTLEEPVSEDLPMPEDTLIYQKGVKEGKRLMMEEAVEGEVIKTDKHTSIRYKSFYGTDRYFYGIADKQFKPGDKVRIIISPKEDEK